MGIREFIKAMKAALLAPKMQLTEERYEAGHVNPSKASFSERQREVLKNFHGLAESVLSQLKEAIFKIAPYAEYPGQGHCMSYDAVIRDERSRKINILLAQHYLEGNAGMPHFAEAILTYDSGVSEGCMRAVRDAITNSGLERTASSDFLKRKYARNSINGVMRERLYKKLKRD